MEKETKFETIENFLYFADDVGFIYNEYKRLKQENAELRAQLQEERNSIIDEDCGIRVSGPQTLHV